MILAKEPRGNLCPHMERVGRTHIGRQQTRKRNRWAIISTRRLGPEFELVKGFLSDLPIKIATGCEAVIFQEPRLPSGSPDLVIVIWDKKKDCALAPRAGEADPSRSPGSTLHIQKRPLQGSKTTKGVCQISR